MKTFWSVALIISVLLCGCGGADYTYVDTKEEKPGPGLFSGDDGVFTVVNKDLREKVEESEEKAVSE